jgi:cell division protein FtsX
MIHRIYLILKELLSAKLISILVILAVAVSTTALGTFEAIGAGLNSYITKKFAASIPPGTIKVSPKPPKTFFFFTAPPSPSSLITDSSIGRIRKLKGVSSIDPVISLKIPVQAVISIFNFSYRIDINAIGVSETFLGTDLSDPAVKKFWRKPADGSIPAVIPRLIIQAYNQGIAQSNNLPGISEQTAKGLRFRVFFGKSSIRQLDGYAESEVYVTSFTDKLNVLAVILPIGIIKKYNSLLAPGGINEYSSLYVKVKNHESLPGVSSAIKKLGYIVESDRTLSSEIMQLKENVSSVLSAFKMVIILLAGLSIAFSSIISLFGRIEYYRVLRILGASKIYIALMLAVKYAVLGSLGAAAGLYTLKLLTTQFAGALTGAGIIFSLTDYEEYYRVAMFYGAMIPLASIVPALIRLFSRDLGRDY